VVNALVAKDLEEWGSYFSPKARFTDATRQWGESLNLEEVKELIQKMLFKDNLKFKVEQRGYPDCIFYEKNQVYVVYSWWLMKIEKDGKKYEYPYMLSHNFNDEGKIVFQNMYVSSNHLEKL
jgi:hypothetical protein